MRGFSSTRGKGSQYIYQLRQISEARVELPLETSFLTTEYATAVITNQAVETR